MSNEAVEVMTITDHLVKAVKDGFLTVFSKKEADDLISCGSADQDEIEGNRIHGTARLFLAGLDQYILVQNPFKVAEGLIQFFMPLAGCESVILVQTSQITGVSFTE